jgi:membrane protease subunit (stomatin/prohibitin family)
MGIVDFVTGGAKRMMIARPDAAKSQVVYKHPDQTFPFWSQLTVDSDEVCLFFKDGQFKGLLSAGRHTLDTQNIPFLNNIVDRFTGGNVFISELFFVTVSPIYNEGFGGPLGSMRDPELDLRVNPRVFGTYSFRVADPTRFVIEFWRQRGGDSDAALQWVRDQIVMGVKTTLTNLIKSGELTMMDLGTAGPDVARAVVQKSPDLGAIGVQLLEIAKLNINLSEEDQARIDEFQDQIVQAKIDARKAKISVARAEAEAQARQYALDQDFAIRSRYVNQVDMGRYQQYAGAEATLGLGQGLADAGGAGGAAGAQMMAGMGLAAGLAAGSRAMPQQYPQGYPAQAYQVPGPPAAAGYAPTPVAAGASPAAPPQVVDQPGARAPAFCSQCGTPASGGKFCSNCGQTLGA